MDLDLQSPLLVGCHVSQSEISRRGANKHHGFRVERNEPQKVNVNTATKAELMALPGIGAAKAQQIIAGRPYHRVDELWQLFGFGEKTMLNIRDKVTVASR